MGCRGLSARKLAEHAGVNLGMFHYHFRTRENFIRTLLQQTYEQMFSMLVIRAHENASPLQNLSNALHVLAEFARTNRQLLVRIAADALIGEQIAIEFLQANLPRHLGVLTDLIDEAQRQDCLVQAPPAQVLAFLGGAIISPLLLGTALAESSALPVPIHRLLEQDVLSQQAAEQRIAFALRGLSKPQEGTT